MVSSVKPFQLMMGKIIGIAAVGLTGFIIWIVLLMILYTIGLSFLSVDTLQQAQNITQQMPQATSASGFQQAMGSISEVIKGLNLPLLIFCFIFYFLGGFLFYASLFAAIGSVVNESPQEAQSLAMPITLPIIFSMVIMFSVISAPSGPLATWASIIPFSSPIVMMARIPFGVPGTVPWWELIASMLSLIAGFLFTTWMAARIYRVGILMYGKKATWKEMMRWAFRKN
jgi:ABC-2 type transport system permease protein